MCNRFGQLALGIMLVQMAGAGAARAADATPAPSTAAAQLAAVDALFLTSYERAVHEVLGDGPPAFLVLPDRLVLYRGRTRREWPLIAPLFNVEAHMGTLFGRHLRQAIFGNGHARHLHRYRCFRKARLPGFLCEDDAA